MLSGLPEIDKIIILNSELKEVVHISLINDYFQSLVLELLPEIVNRYNKNLLNNFALYLLENQALNILKKLFKVYDDINNKKHKLYNNLISSIVEYFMDVMDVQSMTNCFTVVPNDYDWIKLSNIYYEHYFMLFADEDDYNILIVINELLLFVAI